MSRSKYITAVFDLMDEYGLNREYEHRQHAVCDVTLLAQLHFTIDVAATGAVDSYISKQYRIGVALRHMR